jgi:hypothetical protein
MSLPIEFVHGENIANSRSGAVWGARGASPDSRVFEENLKSLPLGPISNSKATNMLEMGYLPSEQWNLMAAGESGFSCGAVWNAGAAWGTGAAGQLPGGAAWGCNMPDAPPMAGGSQWIH